MPKELHNIFSKKKSKPKNLSKIYVDYREKNSLVPSYLIELGIQTIKKELQIGDYIVNDIIIERKSLNDFKSSMINKRLFTQLKNLNQYSKKLLIIETNSGITENSLRGFILSILINYKIPILFTKNESETAKYLYLLANKKEKKISLNHKRKNLSKKQQMEFIIESISGIGPKTSKKLLTKFKTIQNIFNAPQKDLEKILGKKINSFQIIRKEYN